MLTFRLRLFRGRYSSANEINDMYTKGCYTIYNKFLFLPIQLLKASEEFPYLKKEGSKVACTTVLPQKVNLLRDRHWVYHLRKNFHCHGLVLSLSSSFPFIDNSK